eukprot:Clim_evm12s212 gene=Clim_evmTU12s212
MVVDMRRCYNKGCGQEFDESQNSDTSCTYHPGAPFFHDAYKGWSCCEKKSVDFTEFLNIKGCTKGKHNPEKPLEEPKQPTAATEVSPPPEETHSAPIAEPPTVDRDAPMTVLEPKVMSSAKNALIKAKNALEEAKARGDNDDASGEIEEGAPCRNNGCQAKWSKDLSDIDSCVHHPGEAIFHEGMKYWSCCQIKTSDFDNFMAQKGCTTGLHKWASAKDIASGPVDCRIQWFQTAAEVNISVFAKLVDPEHSLFELNPGLINVLLHFVDGREYRLNGTLAEGIVPEESKVTIMGPKVEISMKKAYAAGWQNCLKAEHGQSL